MLSSELLRRMSSSSCDALEALDCVGCCGMTGVVAVGSGREVLSWSDRVPRWGVSGMSEAAEVALL